MSYALKLLATSAAVTVLASTPAFAAGLDTPVVFDISAQSLDTALLQYSRQSGVQVISASETVRNRAAPALRGSATPRQALGALLKDSSLGFVAGGDNTVTIISNASLRATSASPGRPAIVRTQMSVPAPAPETIAATVEPEVSNVDEVVVTGTRIRGVAPVGSNLISVGAEQLQATGAQTLATALKTIPALTGMNGTGQGGNGNSAYIPTIHSLGYSASNSTLVIIDGHRGPTSGTGHSFLDPSIIPINMVERIEVLAEGASAIYGSDAVAGVINFITRPRYDGAMVTGQVAHSDATTGYTGSVLLGKTWDSGSALFAYSHSDQGAVPNTAAAFTFPDFRSRGGRNFLSFNCDPATLQPNGTGPIFLNATSGVSVANSAENATCTDWGVIDRVTEEIRHNVMIKIEQQITDQLSFKSDMLLARRRNEGRISAGSLTATAFQTGAQANPFYIRAAGETGTATRQTVRWNATDLFGPGRAKSGSDTYYAYAEFKYQVSDDWDVEFTALGGGDRSDAYNTGTINASAATLALNGTTSGGGSLTAISIPGTNQIVLNLPLTPQNALDVWNPAAANRTSAEVRRRLLDNKDLLEMTSGVQQVRLGASGTLFQMPGGPAGVAFGAEILRQQLDQFVTRPNNSGPASTGSQQLEFNFDRQVRALYAELNLPFVGPDMGVPLVHRFVVNLSGRYDDYSDFGVTKNPKVGFNWEVTDYLRFRGNWSTSFVAPPLTILGDQFGAFGQSGWQSVTNNIAVPVAVYPQVTQLGIPGCTPSSVSCNISSLQGINVTSGDPDAQAQEGSGWSLGFDFSPPMIRNLRAQVTYWNTEFTGAVTGPNIQNAIAAQGTQRLLTFYPGGASAAQIAAVTQGIPQRSPEPPVTSYIYRTLNSNWLDLYVSGIDASVDYALLTGAGEFAFNVALSEFLKYEQSTGNGPIFSVLNSTGVNGTFPSVKRQLRGGVAWKRGPFNASLFANHTGSYRNWSGNTVAPVTPDANGNPAGGGDKVRANTTFDAHLAYRLEGLLDGVEVALSARNLFDRDPPFYNSAAGFDPFVANPLGRVITFEVRAKLY